MEYRHNILSFYTVTKLKSYRLALIFGPSVVFYVEFRLKTDKEQ
jgi:hypothetical protein